MIVACEDGWLPKKLGAVNERFGTPHYSLLFFYLLGAVTIVSGISLGDIARLGFGFLLIVSMIPVLGCAYLPSKYPEEYAHALFRIRPGKLYFTIALATLCMAGQVFYVMKGLPDNLRIMECVIVGAAVIYVNVMGNYMKRKKQAAAALKNETSANG